MQNFGVDIQLYVLSFLDLKDIVNYLNCSKELTSFGRTDTVWKQIYESFISPKECKRRYQNYKKKVKMLKYRELQKRIEYVKKTSIWFLSDRCRSKYLQLKNVGHKIHENLGALKWKSILIKHNESLYDMEMRDKLLNPHPLWLQQYITEIEKETLNSDIINEKLLTLCEDYKKVSQNYNLYKNRLHDKRHEKQLEIFIVTYFGDCVTLRKRKR
jgi:hypothetical protein